MDSPSPSLTPQPSTQTNNDLLESNFMKLLHSLKVISTIRENDRISTKKGIFVDPSDNPMQSMVRWFTSESRKHNTSTMSSIFDRSFNLCESLVENRAKLSSSSDEQLKNMQQIRRMEQEIRNARRGVANLMITYETDTHTVAKLVLINERIQDRLQRIHHSLSQMQRNSEAKDTPEAVLGDVSSQC